MNRRNFLKGLSVIIASTAVPTYYFDVGKNLWRSEITGDGWYHPYIPLQGIEPVLISMLRESMPHLIAFDICGVQPMKSPERIIYNIRTRYDTRDNRSRTNNP